LEKSILGGAQMNYVGIDHHRQYSHMTLNPPPIFFIPYFFSFQAKNSICFLANNYLWAKIDQNMILSLKASIQNGLVHILGLLTDRFFSF